MMSRLFGFGRRLWIKVQPKIPPSIQRAIVPYLREAKGVTQLLAKPHLTFFQLQGQNQGDPVIVAYAGSEYDKRFLKNILFTEEPVEREIGQVPIWSLSKMATLPASDIVIVEANKHLIHRLPRQNAIVLPHRVELVLDVRGDWAEVKRRFRRAARAADLRRVRKYGYTYEASHSDQDFEMFYHKMYLPSVRARHGEVARTKTFRDVYQIFQRGWLFLIERDGACVSGGLWTSQQGVVYLEVLGVLNSDMQLMREGAQAAVYHALIKWSNQMGYRAVNFGTCLPYLEGGLFQYKRKWGSTVGVPPGDNMRFWIKFCHNTPAVLRFLQDNPCIVVNEQGELLGLITTDDPASITAETETAWHKQYTTPGLNDLVIRSATDLVSMDKELRVL